MNMMVYFFIYNLYNTSEQSEPTHLIYVWRLQENRMWWCGISEISGISGISVEHFA